MINIGKGISLQLLIFCLPKLRAQPLTGQRRETGASHTQHQGYQVQVQENGGEWTLTFTK